MSKRSTNLENLKQQRESIEEKIFKLQIQLKGINKSIQKIENSEQSSEKSPSESSADSSNNEKEN